MEQFIKQFKSISLSQNNKQITLKKYSLGLVYDQNMLLHKSIKSHPECPERVQSIIQNLKNKKIIPNQHIQQIKSIQPIQISLLEKTHGQNYTEFVLNMWPEDQLKKKQLYINVDTYFMKYTAQAAKIAANSVIKCIDKLQTNQWKTAFAIVRPPGHHSGLKSQPHGFCFFNNAAIGANYALQKYKKQRILILDWDAHHGQGTQKLFYKTRKVMYASLHRFDNGKFFPNMKQSSPQFIGQNEGKGYNINIGWNLRQKQRSKKFERFETCGDQQYVYAFERILLPIFKQFNPQLIIVSAGFDSADNDPLGELKVSSIGYGYMTKKLVQINKNIIFVLQGGYNLESLKWGTQSVINSIVDKDKSYLGQDIKKLEQKYIPNDIGYECVNKSVSYLKDYWNLNSIQLLELQKNKKMKTQIKKQLTQQIQGVVTRSKAKKIQDKK